MDNKDKSWLAFCICCRGEERIVKGEMQIPINPIKYEETYDSTLSPSIKMFDKNSNQNKQKNSITSKNPYQESSLQTSTREDTPHTLSFAQANTPHSRTQKRFQEEINSITNRIGKYKDVSLKNKTQVYISSLLNRTIDNIDKPQLMLEIVESKEFEDRESITIVPYGCLNSKRSAKDGVTIFGTQQEEIVSEHEILNVKSCDVVIPSSEHGFGLNHFAIYYEQGIFNLYPPLILEKNSYYVVDLYQGSGTFILLSQPLKVKENHVVSFGNSHATFEVLQNSDVQVKFIAGQLKGQVYEFKKTQEKIKIGRHTTSDIKITENGLSRTQCQLTYTSQGWMLKDGEENKMSTNGTWLFASEPYPISNQLIFKAGKSIFRAHIS